MERHECLAKAAEAVSLRNIRYGTPEDNFGRIAALWQTHLRNRITDEAALTPPLAPSDVAIMLALVKIARLEQDPTHEDSWIDLAGYAACGAEVSTRSDASEPEKKEDWSHPDSADKATYTGTIESKEDEKSGDTPGRFDVGQLVRYRFGDTLYRVETLCADPNHVNVRPAKGGMIATALVSSLVPA